MSHRRDLPIIPLPDAVYQAAANHRLRGTFGNHPPQRPTGPTMTDVATAVGELQDAVMGALDRTAAEVVALQEATEEHSKQIAALRVGGAGDGSPARTAGGGGAGGPWP